MTRRDGSNSKSDGTEYLIFVGSRRKVAKVWKMQKQCSELNGLKILRSMELVLNNFESD